VFRAPTVEEAIRHGLAETGLGEADARIAVEDRGSRGFFGFLARPARVRVGPRDPLSPVVREVTQELLMRMEIPGEVVTRQRGRAVVVEIRAGDGDALLIGRRGETLEAIQHLVVRLAGMKLGDRLEGVTVDVSGYRARREEKLSRLAETLADRVARTGRRAMTEPLSAVERRIVHRALESKRGVTSQVGGTGGSQRIIITPRKRGGGRSG